MADSFILVGTRGFEHVARDKVDILPDGTLSQRNGRDLFLTSYFQQGISRQGLVSWGTWEHTLNGLVASFVKNGTADNSLAQELFIELGKDETRAIAKLDTRAIFRQRVRAGALGFNLLAIGCTWRPVGAAGLPYWERDWVAWCDKYIAESERGQREYEQIGSYQNAEYLELEKRNLEIIRAAFVASPMVAATPQKAGGCYVATSVYGSYEAPQVLLLRQWRDEFLLQSHLGRGFVKFYYAVSPGLVRVVGDRPWFSVPVKRALDTLVQVLSRRIQPKQHLAEDV